MMSRIVQPRPLILASGSPRRAELLRDAGYEFETLAAAIPEPDARAARVSPEQHAESLAWFKAASVGERRPEAVILAADTIAVINGDVIGKPVDRDDARRILRRFSGRTHRVITALALYEPRSDRRVLDHVVSVIHVRKLSDAEIESYLDTGEWQGKAGAYGIQDLGDAFVDRYEGSFTNIVGLPMERLARMFDAWVKGGA